MKKYILIALVLGIVGCLPTLALANTSDIELGLPTISEPYKLEEYMWYMPLYGSWVGAALWVDGVPIASANTSKDIYKGLETYIYDTLDPIIDEVEKVWYGQEIKITPWCVWDSNGIMSATELYNFLKYGAKNPKLYNILEDDTWESISRATGVSVSALKEYNPSFVDEGLEIGQSLTLKKIDESKLDVYANTRDTFKEVIPFKSVVETDKDMWVGDQKLKQEGKLGLKEVEYVTEYKNGKTTKSKRDKQTVIDMPTHQILVVGAKEGSEEEIANDKFLKFIYSELAKDTSNKIQLVAYGESFLPPEDLIVDEHRQDDVTLTGNFKVDAANMAHWYLGRKYVLGSVGPNTFDCSGLVLYLYRQAGADIKKRYLAHDFYKESVPISKPEVELGDLGFIVEGGRATHVGIYVGDNKWIDASSSRGKVVHRPLNWHAYGRFSN